MVARGLGCSLRAGCPPALFLPHLVYSVLTAPPCAVPRFPHLAKGETKAQRSQDICSTHTRIGVLWPCRSPVPCRRGWGGGETGRLTAGLSLALRFPVRGLGDGDCTLASSASHAGHSPAHPPPTPAVPTSHRARPAPPCSRSWAHGGAGLRTLPVPEGVRSFIRKIREDQRSTKKKIAGVSRSEVTA